MPPEKRRPFPMGLAILRLWGLPGWKQRANWKAEKALISYRHLGVQVLRDYATHHREKILAGFWQDKRIALFRPGKLETGGKRGDPYLANRCVGGYDEASWLRLLENDFQFAAFALYIEVVNVTLLQ